MGRVVAGLGIWEYASSTSAQRLCVNPGNRGTVLTELAFRPLHCGLTFSRFPEKPAVPTEVAPGCCSGQSGRVLSASAEGGVSGAVLTVGVCLVYGVLAEVLCLFSAH